MLPIRTGVLVAAICAALSGLATADDAKPVLCQDTNIPPEELKSALTALATEFDFQILYQTVTVASRCTLGVSGSVTQDEALEQALRGTGLTYRYLDKKTITIVTLPGSAHGPAGTCGNPAQKLRPAATQNTKNTCKGVSTPHRERLYNNSNVGACKVRRCDKCPKSRGVQMLKEKVAAMICGALCGFACAGSAGATTEPGSDGPTASAAVAAAAAPATPSSDSSSPLTEVLVTATRSPRAVDHIPGAVAVISGKALADIQHSTLDPDQVLAQSIPGYSASNDDMSTSGELLRGSQPEILLDGVPMSTPLRNINRMSAAMVDPALIQRIEVINGASAIEGLGGSGGLINYITKTPTQEGLVNTVQTAMETQLRSDYIGWRANDLAAYKKGNFDALMFFGTQSRPMYYDPHGNLEALNSNGSYMDSKADNFTAKVGYDFGADAAQRIQVYFNNYDLVSNNDYNSLTPGRRALGIVQSAQRGPGPGPGNANHTRESSVTYTNTEIFGGVLTALGYQSHEAFSFPGVIDPEKQDARIAPIGTLIDASAVTSEKDGAKVYWEKADVLITGLDLNLGYDYNSDRTAQSLVLTNRVWLPELHFTANSAFIQTSLDRGPFTFSAGIRYQSGQVTVPSFQTLYETAPATGGVSFTGGAKNYNTSVYNLGAVYRILQGWSTFVGFSQGYQLPDIGLVIRNTSKPGQSMSTTAAVNPVVTDSYEAGINWRGSKASASADVYYAHSPSSTNVVTDPTTQFQTVLRDPQLRKGIEFSGDWTVLPELTVTGSYSHMLAYTSLAPGLPEGVTIPPSPLIGQSPDKAVLAVEWSPIRATTVAVTATHFWGQNLNVGLSPLYRWFATPYTVVDGSATYDMGAYGTLSLGCSNLTNTFHIENETGTSNTNYYSIQGRKYTVTYQVTF